MRRAALAPLLAVGALSVSVPVASIGPGGWDHVGHGATAAQASLNGAVYALNADDPGVLLVGGNFTSAGGVTDASRVATWNGTSWGALSGPPISNGAVNALAYHAGKVYAGGTFVNAGGEADADFLAVWDGSGWGPFCNAAGPAFGGNVMALQVLGNTLYVGGAFQNGAGIAAADYLLACDLTTGASSSTVPHDGDMSGSVYALTADANGILYAGGAFINVEGIAAADHVAAYDGTWHAMGSGSGPKGGAVEDYVRGLVANGPWVWIGTDALDVADIATADHVARWDGSAWHAVGTDTAGTDGWFPPTTNINTLTIASGQVIAAGQFQNADGVATADDIAYFNGGAWYPIGSNGAGNGPYSGFTSALAVFKGKLYASGNFTSAGGDTRAVSLAAYALKLPDARVGTATNGPWTGDGVYSPTGAGESRTQSVAKGHSVTFYVSIQNDGIDATDFTIRGTGSASGYSVQYFRAATNVTAAVKAGTFSTLNLTPGVAVKLKVVVTRGSSSAASVTYLVKATSVSGTPPDAVKVVVTAK